MFIKRVTAGDRIKIALVMTALLPMFTITDAGAVDVPIDQASMMAVKIAVADFGKSTDFYVRYFGMKPGARYNETEMGVDWPTPGQGSDLILVRDVSAKPALTLGTAWIVFKVADARKTAKEMTSGGVTGVSKPVEITFQGHRTVVVVPRDPDGNQIEMLQIGTAR